MAHPDDKMPFVFRSFCDDPSPVLHDLNDAKPIYSFSEVARLSRDEAIARVGLQAWERARLYELVKAAVRDGPPPPGPDEAVCFISYRWTNGAEIDWVRKFVADLVDRGYVVVFDRFAHEELEPPSVPDLISRMVRCNYFVPILTDGYCLRLQIDDRSRQIPEDGWVYDEWQSSLYLASLERIKHMGIWRSGITLPPPLTPEIVADFRSDASYQQVLHETFPTTPIKPARSIGKKASERKFFISP